MSEHTPTPWAIHDNGSFFDIGIPYDGVLGVYPTVVIGVEHCNEANARHIIKAVNYLPKVVEALRDCMECLEMKEGYEPYDSARALLAELEDK